MTQINTVPPIHCFLQKRKRFHRPKAFFCVNAEWQSISIRCSDLRIFCSQLNHRICALSIHRCYTKSEYSLCVSYWKCTASNKLNYFRPPFERKRTHKQRDIYRLFTLLLKAHFKGGNFAEKLPLALHAYVYNLLVFSARIIEKWAPTAK